MTAAAQIAAEGAPIPTALGELRMVYGFRALRRLEETFGSIQGMQTAMQQLERDVDKGGRAFGPMVDVVMPALLHHTEFTEDQLLDALQPRHLKAYITAMVTAMREAFPDDDTPASPGNGAAPAATAPPGSPGPSSITSPPAATGAQTPSSGA